MVICYALCESDKSISNYGVFDGTELVEYSIDDTSVLIQTGEIRNAKLEDGVITVTNCSSVLPTFYMDTYEPMYRTPVFYVVCRCTQQGIEGYLVLNVDCELQFVTVKQLRYLCENYLVTNVRLIPLRKSNVMYPSQYRLPFRHIGDIELED